VSTSTHSHDREEGLEFQPKFDASGLLTCVATDAASGDVLMVAHMNEEALRKTIASGEAWYFSRSRSALWRKGESSGQTQRVGRDADGLRPGRDLDSRRANRSSLSYRAGGRAFTARSSRRRRYAIVLCRCGPVVRSGQSLSQVSKIAHA